MRRLTAIAATLTISTLALSYSAAADPSLEDALQKIGFDLDQLDEWGLYGPEDGKRSLSYEFCAPNDRQTLETLQAIDPTLMIYLQSPGRVGCEAMEVLAIGETHQPNYRDVLINLASLDTVERIEQFWGE